MTTLWVLCRSPCKLHAAGQDTLCFDMDTRWLAFSAYVSHFHIFHTQRACLKTFVHQPLSAIIAYIFIYIFSEGSLAAHHTIETALNTKPRGLTWPQVCVQLAISDYMSHFHTSKNLVR